ncbi:tetratricopeptide repeat-containing sensor histidine kinase [Flavivirga jejuensis]|uniref:histidine kinase n=1 Tax=Flavivirga jejuensis TaxID=870487 RepID=A0ABT8WQ33_9FLAO|nr:tetratricopeptide repeat-containing sensor histidine kinase [Flavivirga jejuensis]MDO5975275.1 tetratricopeptide repeat-containing sensor histidine kinase [Flavivirga jejuensis]
MKINKLKKLLILFLLPCCVFSQKNEDHFALENSIKKVCKGKYTNFHKAHTFFFEKKKDSAFLYSSQALNDFIEESEITDYLNYIHGVNAYEKKFFSIAQKKLKTISSTFPYKYLVDYNLANIALNNNKYEEALHHYNVVINYNKIQSSHTLKRMYHNVGICYLHLKKYPESEKFLLKELSIAQNTKDTLSAIYAKLDLGNLYYQQYKDNKAISYFNKAYTLAKLFSNIEAKQATAKNMAVVEKNRKHYKKSVDYYIEYGKWRDSLWNRDKISELLEKDKQITVAVKDKEIFIQKEIAKKQKGRVQLFAISFIIVFLFLATLLFLYRIKIKQHKLINTQKQQLEKLNTTKNYLLSVISHDLRTSVNLLKNNHKNLSELLNINDTEAAILLNNENTSISESTSQVLDNILNWALQQNDQLLFMPEAHPIEILIDAILFDFKPLAITKNIELVTIHKNSDALVLLDKELFKIAFRNLIDNAIKYTQKGGKISIETSILDKEFILKIKDTGVGMSPTILDVINNYEALTVEKIEKSKGLGIGLQLSKTLITKNNGTFKIVNNPDVGITVFLKFPIQEI